MILACGCAFIQSYVRASAAFGYPCIGSNVLASDCVWNSWDAYPAAICSKQSFVMCVMCADLVQTLWEVGLQMFRAKIATRSRGQVNDLFWVCDECKLLPDSNRYACQLHDESSRLSGLLPLPQRLLVICPSVFAGEGIGQVIADIEALPYC